MPDTFDPDAWPDGGNGASNGRPAGGKSSTSEADEPDIFGPPTEPAAAKEPKSGDNDSSWDDDQDDFANFGDMGDFGDYDPEPAPRRKSATATKSERSQDRDDFYDEDDDDDPYDTGYDDDDDFDSFDREPDGGGDNKRRLIGIGAAVFLIGAIVFLGVGLLGKDDGPPAAPPVAAPQGNAPAPVANPGATPAAPEGPPPADVKQALDTALERWGAFAVNGDLNEVRPYFSPTGEQYNQFQIESPEIKGSPPGGPPFTMKMDNPQASEINGEWVVRGLVNVSRPNEQAQQFPWEMRLIRQSEREPWQILTIRQY